MQIADARVTEARPGNADRLGIPIDSEQLDAALAQSLGVTAITQGAVHRAASAACRVDDCLEQNRPMKPRIGGTRGRNGHLVFSHAFL